MAPLEKNWLAGQDRYLWMEKCTKSSRSQSEWLFCSCQNVCLKSNGNQLTSADIGLEFANSIKIKHTGHEFHSKPTQTCLIERKSEMFIYNSKLLIRNQNHVNFLFYKTFGLSLKRGTFSSSLNRAISYFFKVSSSEEFPQFSWTMTLDTLLLILLGAHLRSSQSGSVPTTCSPRTTSLK